MSTFAEYTKKKKKKDVDASELAKKHSSFRGYTEEVLGIELAPIKTPVKTTVDIAPVKPTVNVSSTKPADKITSLMSVYGNKDFSSKSGYVSTKSEGIWEKLGSKYGMNYNDLQYEYINNQNDIRKEIDSKAVSWGSDTGKTSSSYKEKALDYMTEDEVAVYNYYYQTEGKDKAQEFLDALAETLNARKAGKDFESIEGKTAREILYGTVSGAEQFKQGVKGFGSMITGKDDYIPQTSTQILTGKIREDLADDGTKVFGNSLGQVVHDALSTGTNMLPSVMTGGVAGTILMGATAAGNAYQQDLNEFGDKEKARIYATTIGALEGTLQHFMGGIGQLGGTSAAISNAVSGVKNGALRFALEYGGKIGSEALEEGLQEVLDPVVKNWTHGTEESVDWENVAYSALLGGLMGGVFGAGEVSSTHLNANENAVVDKVYNDTIAEREADGKKLSQKEKAKIYDETITKLEKGYIDIDTIESVIGGDTYHNYKAEVDKEAMQEADYKRQLEALKDQANTLGNAQKYQEIEAKLNELKNNSKTTEIKKQLSEEVSKIIQGTKLSESYNEIARRGQDLEVDVESYKNDHAKQTAQNFKDFGVNNTNATHDYLDLVTKVAEDRGHTFKFMTTKQLEESIANGNPYNIDADPNKVEAFVSGSTKEIIINMDANKSLSSLVGHEITHTMEADKVNYEQLQKALFKLAETRGEYKDRLSSVQRRYKNLSEEQQMQELTSDLVGDYVFGDSDFISNLSTENPNIFKKIYNEIKYLWKMATAGSKEARELERVKREFEKIWRESSQDVNSELTVENNREMVYNDNRYSLFDQVVRKHYDTKQTGFWVNDYDTYYKVTVNEDLSYDVSETININGNEDYIKELIKETKNADTNRKNISSSIAKTESVAGINDWDNASTQGEQSWSEFISEVLAKFESEGIDGNNTGIQGRGNSQDSLISKTSSKDGVFFDAENVKYSIADSKGRKLSNKTQEYFVDSKIRDENNNLKVMYHGSPAQFTVFDKKKAKSSGYYGRGFYFSESESHAGQYGSKYEVYLNIKNPVQENTKSITKEQLRRFVNELAENEDYGIENYGYDATVDSVTDDVYGKDDFAMLMDLNASCVGDMAAAIQLFNEVNGTDYDGIVAPTETVAFYPNQIKSVENTNPTSDADIRFSLSDTVEETKDLIAVHNLRGQELLKTLELGGLPMPSVAIIKAQDGHEMYGDVTLILPKDTIDPKADKANKVYGGDAWTPTYPKIEYKPNAKVEKKISDKYYEFANKYGYDEARPLYNYVHEMEDALNRSGGESALLEKLYEDTNLMQMFLQDTGKEKVQPIVNETETRISDAEAEMNQYLIDTLGSELVSSFKVPAGENPMKYRKAYMEEHETEIRDAYAKLCEEVYGFTTEEVENVLDNTNTIELMKIMRGAYMYTQNNGVTVKTETDYEATKDAIRNSAKDGYKEWVDNLFKGVEEKTGIRNNADVFTRSGNRRSWDALHWENTLENVVKVMKQQDNGQAFFGGVGIWGVSAKEYGSIQEIKSDSDRLRKMSDDEYEKVKESYQNRLSEIAGRIMSKTERNQFIAIDDAMSAIVDSVRVSKTAKGIFKELKQYGQLNVTEKDAADIVSLVKDIANMPTGYFEAKPQRAVGLDEVGVFVIPYDTDAKLKQELLSKGYSIAEYDPNIEGDRKRVVNQFEEYKFRIADDSYTSKEYGNHIYAKDVALEGVAEIAPTTSTVEEMPIRSDYAPPQEYMSAEPEVAPVVEEVTPAAEDNERILGEDLTKKNADRIKTIQAEIKGHHLTKDITKKEFDEKIAQKESQYESLSRKDTKKAVDLRNQITRLETKRDSLLRGLDGKIERANKRIESIENESRFAKRITKQNEYRELFGKLMGDTSTWKDKKMGIQYQTNTFHRNLRDIVRDASGKQDIARADAIYDELQGSVNRNEAKKNREANEVKNVFREMKINNAESTYIQMLGELRHNPDTTLTKDVVDEFYKKNKGKIDVQKVDKAIDEARKLYDSLYDRVNVALSEHGFKEIGYRKGYFPHFTDPKRNWLAKLLNWKVNNDEIPTDIAGLTEMFEPQRTWQSFDKHRKTDTTDYNFLKGLDNYVNGSLDWIYHIEDIQKHRAFENEIRYRHSSEQVQKKIDEYRNNPMLSAEEVDTLIQSVLREAKNPLNNFVTDLHTRTNILAGKKSSKDRNMESDFNRHAYSVMTNITNRVTANQVVGSISSAMTNFIPITQSWGQVNPTSSLVGMKKTIQSYMSDDGVVAKSDFLTNRLAMNEALYKDAWDKIGDKVGGLMEIVDNFTSQTVWRSKYHENIKKGMTEAQAIKDADQFAENVIGGRSKGNMPTIFHAKNPVTKMLTSFQLEVANQYGYIFKDMPQDIGKKAIGKLVKGYATMFIGAYAYNALYSSLVGRDAALDPLGIIEDFIRDLGGDDDEEEDVAGAIGGLASNVADEIPFVGGLLGGGRIPISSALPYNASISDAYADVVDKDWKSVLDELSKPLYYGVMPMGGGQIRKTVQGLSMFDKDLPVSGSYTKSGNLRFPVEDTFLNKLQAGVFGQYASENARDYFDNERNPLKEKQIQEYKDLELPIRQYWDYREGLKEQETLEDKFEYIADLDVSDEQKNIMINNIVDRKEKVDMSNYDDFANYEEFDWYTKNTEKYNFLEANGVSYSEYKADEETKKEYDNIYSWYKNNPDKVTLSKAVTNNVIEYRRYASDLDDIRADKDSSGKTISGSSKKKKTEYINSLDLDYGQRIILYRSLFDSNADKAAYNADIVEYLNSRDDITYEEMVTILESLDMKVLSDGTVAW